MDWWTSLRDSVLQETKNRNESFLKEYCEEAKVETPVGYYEDYRNREYVIYTNRCGLFIGKYGALIDKYQKKLKEINSSMDKIRFVEIKVDLQIIKSK